MMTIANRAIVLFILSLGFLGCAATPPSDWQRAGAQPVETNTDDLSAALPSPKGQRWSGRVTAVASQRADVPNAALQLPRVSPDGQWIAFLDQPTSAGSPAPATTDDLVSGRNLGHVSLWLRSVEGTGAARPIATPALAGQRGHPSPTRSTSSSTTTNWVVAWASMKRAQR